MTVFHAFATPLGYIGIALESQGIGRLVFGHRTEAETFEWLAATLPPSGHRESLDLAPRPLRRLAVQTESLLTGYANGEPIDLAQVPLQAAQHTQFQRDVLQVCRKIPYGSRLEYGEIADQIGRPRAARAVGTVMANNAVPLLIPCHRVVATGGRLGGYSCPQGWQMKERLLAMEQETVAMENWTRDVEKLARYTTID